MKIALVVVGKTSEKYLQVGIDIYQKRLKHYCNFEWIEIKDMPATSDHLKLMQLEAEVILSKLKIDDCIILLDENGQQLKSREFANFLEKKVTIASRRRLVFMIGGAFGFHELIKKKSEYQLSLSKMTFSHQMIRLFFIEQLYRAFTIIKNEKYHND